MPRGAEPLTIPATDSLPLGATIHEPETAEGMTAVIAPATGVARGYYAPFAAYLAERGFRVVSFDYRGIGESPLPDSPRQARMHDWGARDLAGVLEWAVETRPTDRLLVVGHSAGGQLLGLAPRIDRVEGLLAVAAQSGYYGHWSGRERIGLWLLWTLAVPVVTTLLGSLPGRLFGSPVDLPGGVAREWARWCLHPDYLLGHVAASEVERYRRFRGPLLALAFEDDFYAPPAAVTALLTFYPGADGVTRKVATPDGRSRPLGHFGFFRPAERAGLWAAAARWLRNASPGVPGGGADAFTLP